MKATISNPAIWLLILLVGFPQISETIYSPALPNVASQLQTSNSLVQWTLSIYFIGFACGVLTWGWLSDHIGRKKPMLMGLLTYGIASFLCLSAHNIAWLLFARLLQGFGASCGSVLTQAIARESLNEHQRHQFFATSGFVLAVAIALGPFIGGYLTEWFNWRANFTLLVIIGVSLFSLVSIKLAETKCEMEDISETKLAKVFCKIIQDKRVLACAWLVGTVNGIVFSYYAESPFIFIKIVGLTPSEYGWLGVLLAFAALLGTTISKKLIHKISHNSLLIIGCMIMLISSLLLALVAFTGLVSAQDKVLSIVLIMLPMMGLIFGSFGFIIPIILSLALLKYHSVLGRAGAIFGLIYYVIVALLTWLMGWLHNGTVLPMPVYFTVLSISISVTFYLFHQAQ